MLSVSAADPLSESGGFVLTINRLSCFVSLPFENHTTSLLVAELLRASIKVVYLYLPIHNDLLLQMSLMTLADVCSVKPNAVSSWTLFVFSDLWYVDRIWKYWKYLSMQFISSAYLRI